MIIVGYIGYYSLIFTLIFSFVLLYFSFQDLKKNNLYVNKNIYSFSFLQILGIFLCFSCLIFSFIQSDFSLAAVYENSHTQKPLLYKISGTWGNHEGSLILWILILILFSFLFLILSKKQPKKYRIGTIIFQNLIIIGFILFSIFTSNAFEKLFPIPKEGLGLNPILQDPALAVHPPTLYVGYVGSSIFFSSALSAMINNYVGSDWARLIRPWILISWIFLTLGIFLGSVWAYYELGWGGFWFWDPVENASLLPWLAITALFHSILVLEKRGVFHSWVIVLAISSFTLSMTGTFLVRSGILNSVHTFASDPYRGIYILTFLFSLSLMALIIFYFYQPESNKNNFSLNFLSKEFFILINNWFIIFFLVTVLIGTIYPIFLDVIKEVKISIGPPFYHLVLVPFIIPFMAFMAVGPKLNWIKTNLNSLKKDFLYTAIISLSFIFGLNYFIQSFKIIYLLIFLSALFLIFNLTQEIFLLIKNKKNNFKKLGRHISHFGFSLLIFSIALNAIFSKENTANIEIGQDLYLSNYQIKFESVEEKKEKNFISIIGKFTLLDKKKSLGVLKPEIRIYEQPKTITSEVSILSHIFSDFYLNMSYIQNEELFNVRFQYKPFMFFIWSSVILIVIGGFLSLFNIRKK